MPDNPILVSDGKTTHWMHASDTTATGYNGTDYRTKHRSTCEEKVKAAFGDHILKHREMISTASSGGVASNWGWYDTTVELPSEIMMYGSVIWGKCGYNTGTAQLELARLDPSKVSNRSHYWLRDVAGSASFVNVGSDGYASFFGASSAWVGVRPYFLLH